MGFAIFDGFSHTQLFLTMSPSEEVIANCKRQTLFTELLQEHIFGSLLLLLLLVVKVMPNCGGL